MLEVIVRSKRDADAVKALHRIFYSEWGFRVHTLHGVRSAGKALDELSEIISNDRFYVVLLGREDAEMAEELDKLLPPNVVVHVVPRARVRNTRMEHLFSELNIAKSRIRLAVFWDNKRGSYVFMPRSGDKLESFEYNPAYDVFLGLNSSIISSVVGGDICDTPLLLRKFGGEHIIYCGRNIVAKLHIPDHFAKPRGELYSNCCTSVCLDNVVKANREAIELYEKVSISFLRRYVEWADTVVVPWSGGKDSTATLLLTLKVFPKKKIRVVTVDTGVEFPQTLEYIDEVSRKLGIEPYRVYAGVDRGIIEEGMPMPRHDNRWCTGRKIASIERAIEDLSQGNTLVVTGDRDVESKTRSIRPPARVEKKDRLVVTPIKLWSTAHVQLYLMLNNIQLNPLYYMGFYRIGCYICPALRSWELYIVMENSRLRRSLEDKPLFKKFICMKRGMGEKHGSV